jgi:hypothetical protein
MPGRPRRLTHGGIPRVPPVFALAAAAGALVMVSGCAGVPSTPSRTPPPSSTPTAVTIVTPSPTPQLVGTTRTVLSPLGLRIHSAPVLDSKNVLGGFSQGRTFTVLEYQSGGGGWFRVQGQTLTGWVVADPSLSAASTFNRYSAGLPGYTPSSSASVLVCGYTGTLAYYVKAVSYTGPTPVPLPVARQPLYAEIRLTIDSTHAMLLGFNYENSSQLDVFSALYNSIAFPFPLCEAPAATPKPAP